MKIIPPAKDIYKFVDGSLRFNPEYKIIIWKGGRGRGASHGFTDGLSVVAAEESLVILCVREVQRSIRDSVHKLLKTKIISNGLDTSFRILERTIKCVNGSEFIFSGLLGQEHTIRSLEGVNITYMEEAQKTSKSSFDSLIPTVTRTDGCQILIAYNPDSEDDPVEELCKRDDALVVHSTIYENPLAPQTLLDEAERCRKNDPETWQHVWMGGFNKRSQEQVFGGKCVTEFIPANDAIKYYGLDWGFASDPTVFTVMSIVDDDVLVHDVVYWYGKDPNEIAELLHAYDKEDKITNYIYCDSADTGSGRILKRAGLPAKYSWGKHKIADRVRWMRSHRRIVFNTGLPKEVQNEIDNYKYKLDKRTGEITIEIVDAHNHMWDSLMYGPHRLIRRGTL